MLITKPSTRQRIHVKNTHGEVYLVHNIMVHKFVYYLGNC